MRTFYKEQGRNFVEAEFEYQYDVPSFLSYYGKILTLAGLERLTGIHQGQLSHYVTGHRKPGRKTTEKIEKKLHEFAEDHRQVSFFNLCCCARSRLHRCQSFSDGYIDCTDFDDCELPAWLCLADRQAKND